ncbi:hypothetical protein [Prevotella sp.]|uniref:hypothetical protein n=1 Tax=Prevotella sp. TaxID=59823 RepID=UPI0025FDE91C|nr:hypothetical protein [Prevotella sp.]
MRHFHILIALLVGFINPAAAQENKYSIDGKHRGLDFSINAGYNAGVGDMKGSSFLPLEIGVGKQFHPNLYIGVRSGAWVAVSDKATAQIPIMSDFKVMFPSSSEGKLKPIINARFGYLLNTEGGKEIEVEDGEGGTISAKSESVDMIVMELMPGVQIPISKTADFILSAGYTHGFATKGGGGGGFFSVKTAINFHKRDTKRPPREKVETRDKGLQYTIEGVANNRTQFGGGGNLVFTYKLNPHISIGAGGGYHAFSPYNQKSDGDDYIQYIERGVEDKLCYQSDIQMYNFFARGNYRLTDRRFSPMATMDIGVRKYNIDEDFYGYNENLYEVLGFPSTSLYVAPAIGVSIRTTKNSYFEFKLGYNIGSNVKAKKVADFENDVYASTPSKNMSYGFFSIGFTHTLGKRGARL